MNKLLKKLPETIALMLAFTMLSVAALAQGVVSGKVTDSKNGLPLTGVTVTVKGTRTSAQTNNDGTFNTTGSELVLDLANMTVGNTVVSGTFVIPGGTPVGSYRIRVASDGQGANPPPCGPLQYSADFEDYTLVVNSTALDVASQAYTLPGFFIVV